MTRWKTHQLSLFDENEAPHPEGGASTDGAPFLPPADATGFDSAPSHYAGEREAIDTIRDYLTHEGFVHFCLGNAAKYRLRAGRKGAAEEDIRKAEWYEQMAAHAGSTNAEDPRAGREGFVPYERQMDNPACPALDAEAKKRFRRVGFWLS